jgi:uncharacterized YigZ family protein
MLSYKTFARPAEAVLIEKKSRFLAFALTVTSEEDIQSFLSGLRKKYWDANHHVYAYILKGDAGGPVRSRSSDDGEPSGSAGVPVLEVLSGAGVVDALVVVIRYFGGTLLGVGGLIRAYSGAAKLAMAEAKISENKLCREYTLELDYAAWNRVKHVLAGYRLEKIDYGELITAYFIVEADETEMFERSITDATAGQAIPTNLGEKFYALS